MRLFALVILTLVLIGLCVALAVPFLPAITWAVALAILAWPIHRWIAHRVARRGLAAALTGYPVMTNLRKLLPVQEVRRLHRRRSMPRCVRLTPPT
jgi:hypothetical protein